MWWFIGIGVFVLIMFLANKSTEKAKKISSSLGYDYEQRIEAGNYISGHPRIDNPKVKVSIIPKDGKLDVLYMPASQSIVAPQFLGDIETSLIENITVEDQSTFERRLTLGRVALVGVFALAWKKKKKNELVYLTLFWKEGKFDNEMIFEFEGPTAIQSANTARNKLIAICK